MHQANLGTLFRGQRRLLWLPRLICVCENCLSASKFLLLTLKMWHGLFPYYLCGSVVYFSVPFLDLWLFCCRWFRPSDRSQLFGHVGSWNTSSSTPVRLEYSSSFLMSIGKAQSKSIVPYYTDSRIWVSVNVFARGEAAIDLAIGMGILRLNPQASCHSILALLYLLLDRKFVNP